MLARGEAGGLEAANILSESAAILANELVPGLPTDFKIVARIYANLKGLADVCHKAGLVATPTELEDFARGFTRGRILFDFVDVGSGKDRADEKVSGQYSALAPGRNLADPTIQNF